LVLEELLKEYCAIGPDLVVCVRTNDHDESHEHRFIIMRFGLHIHGHSRRKFNALFPLWHGVLFVEQFLDGL
jgi:hypothetical protein